MPSSVPMRRISAASNMPGRYCTIVIVIAWMPTATPAERCRGRRIV